MIAEEILAFIRERAARLRTELSTDPRFVDYEEYMTLLRRLEVAGDAAPSALVEAFRPEQEVRDVCTEGPSVGDIHEIGDSDLAEGVNTAREAPSDRLTVIGVRSQEGRGLLRSILAEASSPLNRREIVERLRLRGYRPAGRDPLSEVTKAFYGMSEVENPDRAGYRLRRPADRPVA